MKQLGFSSLYFDEKTGSYIVEIHPFYPLDVFDTLEPKPFSGVPGTLSWDRRKLVFTPKTKD